MYAKAQEKKKTNEEIETAVSHKRTRVSRNKSVVLSKTTVLRLRDAFEIDDSQFLPTRKKILEKK